MKLVKFAALSALAAGLCVSAAQAEDWTMKMTVDNQFQVYFGTANTTTFAAGGGNAWTTTYTINATGRAPTDYLYVSTSSDQSAAQGLIGSFTNIDRGVTLNTGSADFQVFPAGRYLQQLFGQGGAWPVNTIPTQAQVNAAINYATTNTLWQSTDGFTNWDNRTVGNSTIWGHRAGIPDAAEWIWHNTAGFSSPLTPGANHDEFLVFRINGIPAPGAAGVLALGGLAALRRRR